MTNICKNTFFLHESTILHIQILSSTEATTTGPAALLSSLRVRQVWHTAEQTLGGSSMSSTALRAPPLMSDTSNVVIGIWEHDAGQNNYIAAGPTNLSQFSTHHSLMLRCWRFVPNKNSSAPKSQAQPPLPDV